MSDQFPSDVLLEDAGRRKNLIQNFFELHHRRKRDIGVAKGEKAKLEFYRKSLAELGEHLELCIDLGCRGGAITQGLLPFGNWLGVDIDRNAIEMANSKGIPCIETDISVSLEFRADTFDAVCMTEVLEHLPYPSVTLSEIWRILKKNPKSVFFGSVPLDYHLRRRIQVLRGRKISKDPTHLRSFSFKDIKELLEGYFETVEYHPVSGMKLKFPFLSWNHFVHDIAWFAKGPKINPEYFIIQI